MGRQESLFGVPHEFFQGARIYSADASPAQECGITAEAQAEETPVEQSEEDVRLSRWTCGSCGLKFQKGEDQRAHFKSDFHRLNVKRKSAGKSCFNEEEFEKFAAGDTERDCDVSSVSGSESEIDDEEKERVHKQAESKQVPILLNNGSVVEVWRSLLLNGKEKFDKDGNEKETGVINELELLSRLKALAASPKVVWAVFLSVGGHFAGLVVDMKTGVVQAHQTYHRYVVRAKAGGKQSTRDATGRAPKSAGASLRRYNEMALQKEIKALLGSWSGYLREASCIFVAAPSRNNQSLFGEIPLLDRSDLRIRQVPFPTRRPTYKEARRVYSQLSLLIYKEKETLAVPEEDDAKKAVSEVQEKAQEKKVSKQDSSKIVKEEEEVVVVEVQPALHEAAVAGNASLVAELLEKGEDPCLKYHGRTPYASATDKDTRNAFRKFMASHPEKWDWNAANVPSPLTEEMEAAQAARQAEKNAKRKAKEKERKKERKAQEKATKALNASAALSAQQEPEREATRQRELRAAAAESRLRGALSSNTLEVCSLCASSLANKVPFYKFNYKYCSVSCVNAHRRVTEED